MATRAMPSTFPHDFFTPHPRRVKGKERAVPGHDVQHHRCTTAPDAAVRSVPLPGARPVPVLRDLSGRHRARRLSGRKWMHAPVRTDAPSLHNLAAKHADVAQRRHASSLPEATASSSSPAVLHLDQWRHQITNYSSGAVGPRPEQVWDAFESLYGRDECASIDVRQLLDFGVRLVGDVQSMRFDDQSSELLLLWGTRLQTLLDCVSPRIKDHAGDAPLLATTLRLRALTVSAAAMTEDVNGAVDGLREIMSEQVGPEYTALVAQMYTAVILSVHQYRQSIDVLYFLVEEWGRIGTYLRRRRFMWEDEEVPLPHMRTFKQHAYSIVSRIEKPVAFMLSVQDVLTQEQRQTAGEFLIDVLCEANMGNDALDVLEIMQQQSFRIKIELQLEIVWALAKGSSFELANMLFMSISRLVGTGPLFTAHQKLGLFLFARQGDVPRAEEYFNRLVQRHQANSRSITLVMHAHAVKGDTDRVVELFHHFFPPASPSKPEPRSPNLFHYTVVIYAFSRNGDLSGMNQWLEKMTQAGIKPDTHVYTIILQSFAERGDMAHIADLLNQMHAVGLPPTRHAYTTILGLLARRRDPVAAEEIYKRALTEGVVPDRRMLTALMNAYVESGQWAGVIRAFDYIHSSAHRGIRLSLEIYNTLLKAYVYIGAPFRVVASLFQKLEDARVRPDAHTFALLIQSACDSDLLEIAAELFAEMERLAENWQSHLHINTYVMTILMSGYLRRGQRGRAKAVLDAMRKRGIQPTAHTYSAIMQAYSKERTGAGVQVAEEFLQSLLNGPSSNQAWMKSSGNRVTALEAVFAPLLVAYTERRRPEQVERLYQEMLAAGGEPTIGTLTALMDAHRKTGSIKPVLEIWPRIYELALRYTQSNALFEGMDAQTKPDLRGHSTIMCVPLSIVTDALSAAGLHGEVAKIWGQLSEARLAFDSHNWNHLVVALVRAGEPERAFDVVEKVILPHKARAHQRLSYKRDQAPPSPVLDVPVDILEDELPRAQAEFPGHSRARRVIASKTATKKFKPTLDEGKPNDFAHALHVLAQISPLWNLWRPHEMTITVLGDVLGHLRSGRLVQPVRPDYHPQDDLGDYVRSVEDLKARAAQAGRILGRIYDNCPQTVKLIRDLEAVKDSQMRRAKYRGSQ
ncbi:uncharacterized protein FIBRA_02692 [Fibroporia radiculosa]|uniref:Pentacotripeptide-repeat region of PRORP domain-containing protein n=1 Tax=Fibroporia radiculosa TaxID=599839 RepID=J4H1Z9_9APHY|nr:uncharacterized protein FIBRA_02692 [Fibroporia radiculosa]CCM00654.1 predicted protein [Fibroporia radiculosa]